MSRTAADRNRRRAAFVVKNPELWEKLKNYAYTERITIAEAAEEALSEFLKDKTVLDRTRARRSA